MHLIDTKFYVKNVLFAVKTIFAVSLTKKYQNLIYGIEKDSYNRYLPVYIFSDKFSKKYWYSILHV